MCHVCWTRTRKGSATNKARASDTSCRVKTGLLTGPPCPNSNGDEPATIPIDQRWYAADSFPSNQLLTDSGEYRRRYRFIYHVQALVGMKSVKASLQKPVPRTIGWSVGGPHQERSWPTIL